MKNNHILFLAIIVFLAAVLRLVGLSSLPPSLNWDEVSHGYNAFSILKTGADEWGRMLPVFNFRAYGDYPLPLNLYLTIPFIFFMGLSEFSIRFPHALLGILSVISTYYLAWGLSKNKNIGLISSFLVAISPWCLFTSRIVLQSNLSIFLLITSMALFVHREKKKYFFPVSLIFLLFSLFAYHTTRIFSPLLLLGLIILFKKEFKNKLIIFLSFAIFLTAIIALVNPEGRARSRWVFIVNEAGVNQIIENRNTSNLPKFVKRLLYNRPTYFITKFGENYFNYFSPKYLFLQGGTQYQFSIPNHGLEYIINLPFFYIGLLVLFLKIKKEKDKNSMLIVLWLLLSPVAASATTEKFAVLRSSTMIPLVEIISAMGLIFILDMIKKWKKVALFLYLILNILLLSRYLSVYSGVYAENYSWSWQYGYKQAVNYIKENYDKYDKIVISKKYGEPHEFLLFFLKYEPKKYIEDTNLIRFFQSDWYWVDGFDKYYFVNDWEVNKFNNYFVLESGVKVDCTDTDCLLIAGGNDVKDGWKLKEKILFLNGDLAFGIYDNK